MFVVYLGSVVMTLLWIYGVGGVIAPFIGIKAIDLVCSPIM